MRKTTSFLIRPLLIVGAVVFLLGSCKKEESHNVPTVTTAAVTEITQTTATSGGNITSDGGAIVTARGVCWSTRQNPIISGSKTTDGAGTGSFTSSLTNLEPNTTYYVRAYATNSEGTSYGNEVTFKTLEVINLPTVTTVDVTEITQTTAMSGGNITSDGGAAVTARGVCWGTSQNPTVNDNKTADGAGTGSFTSSLTNLASNTIYYVRAYATNSEGTSYGSEVSFKTLEVINLPTVTTTAVTTITLTTATLGGNVTSDGGGTVTARGVCWGTSQSPTISGSKTVDGTGTGSFTSNLTNLESNTIYYVRSYATNSEGTSYGNEVNFTTENNTIINPDGVTGTLTDKESNVYKIIKIEEQWWMAENLRYLPSVVGPATDSRTKPYPYYYVYGYDGTDVSTAKATQNYTTYGVLYNFEAAKLSCPSGWHLPNNDDWMLLIDGLNGIGGAGGQLKETGTEHWMSPNYFATNEVGFTALPGGTRSNTDVFRSIGSHGYWWSAFEYTLTSSYYFYMNYNSAEADYYYVDNEFGLSVRCVRDNQEE